MGSLGIDIGGSSVKVCLIDGDQLSTARSFGYTNPTREVLSQAINDALAQLDVGTDTPVGLCLPGRQSKSDDSIECSINLPCLNGWSFAELLKDGIGFVPESYSVLSDVQAAGEDYIFTHDAQGRVAIIAIGTGVGLCVFDDAVPIGIGKASIGHLGMMDIGRLGQDDLISPDGSKNTLESYIGTRAIELRFPGVKPEDLPDSIATLTIDEQTIQALVRAIRVVHAIYVPDQIVLMGGVGIAFKPLQSKLQTTVNDGLTSLANPNWRLMFGDSPYHAARGAAGSVC